MSTMTFNNALLPLAGTDGAEHVEAKATKGFWARFVAALVESRMRSAEREVARIQLALGLDLPSEPKLSLKVDTKDLPFAG